MSKNVKIIVIPQFSYIIGELIFENEEYLEFNKPLLMTPVMTQNGNIQLAPTPILVPISENIKVNKNHIIILPYDPPNDIYKEYISLLTNIKIV